METKTAPTNLGKRIDTLDIDRCRRMLIALGKQGLISTDKRQMRRQIKILIGEAV